MVSVGMEREMGRKVMREEREGRECGDVGSEREECRSEVGGPHGGVRGMGKMVKCG
jgi:hypothetical protein